MSLPYKLIVQSKPFRFLVGANMDEFFLHPSLVGSHSRPLEAMMHGKMQEARDGCATIDDANPDIFARFCEYLYTGDYTAAEHSVLLGSTLVAQEDDSDWGTGRAVVEGVEPVAENAALAIMGSGYNRAGKKGAKSEYARYPPPGDYAPTCKQTDAWAAFCAGVWPREPARVADEPRPNSEPCEDYSEVFLSHAQVYVFADKYDIGSLRALALHKLHKTMMKFTLYKERVNDIAMLLQYTYQHTAEREGCMDSLRAVVVEYMVCHVEKMVSDDLFEAVLKAENSAAIDLVRMLRTRL